MPWLIFFRNYFPSSTASRYLVIDGLDECEKEEKEKCYPAPTIVLGKSPIVAFSHVTLGAGTDIYLASNVCRSSPAVFS